MDQNVSEGDYLLIIRDLAGETLVQFRKLAKRLADSFELPLNAGLQQRIPEVALERLPSYELRD